MIPAPGNPEPGGITEVGAGVKGISPGAKGAPARAGPPAMA
jgi:hypothetical protein